MAPPKIQVFGLLVFIIHTIILDCQLKIQVFGLNTKQKLMQNPTNKVQFNCTFILRIIICNLVNILTG